jgi:hypothetical protein
MRFISTKMHAMTEVPLVLLLLILPNIFSLSDVSGASAAIPRVLAVAIAGLALVTKYELGVFKIISMANHLRIDTLAAAFLVLSPFLFGFDDEGTKIWLPHVLVGLVYLGTSLMTKTEPGDQAVKK